MKIVSTAPSRISLFGGGTDTDPFASKFGGVCINVAINLRQHLTLYTEDEMWELNDHPFPAGANREFPYKILEEFGIGGMHHTRIKSEFDGIMGAGIGSSASFAVCLIGAIDKAFALNLTKEEIAKKAWDIEVNKMGWYGGKQDQFASVYGGLNLMRFGQQIEVIPFLQSLGMPLVSWMVLFDTGLRREVKKIQEGFKELNNDQIKALQYIKEICLGAGDYIAKGQYVGMGKLLDLTWKWKKQSNPLVSTPKIDEIYERGKENGALGGKILGAGNGGYILFFINPSKRKKFVEKMGLEEIDFSLDFNGLETRRL